MILLTCWKLDVRWRTDACPTKHLATGQTGCWVARANCKRGAHRPATSRHRRGCGRRSLPVANHPSALEYEDCMEHKPFDRLLLIGHGSPHSDGNAEYYQFANELGTYLGITVQPCFLELAEPSIVAGIRQCVAEGAQRIAVLPLLLGPAGHQKSDIPALLDAARAQYPTRTLRYGTPIGAHYQLVRVLEERAAATLARSTAAIATAETAVLLVARGSSDPDSNAEVSKLARLLYEGRGYGTG
ncbi:MAG: sirohydrochlorin chelatase [Blastochloris sp.]|nr:sirohydrochlorin chelatase [Blastochloris sp.]